MRILALDTSGERLIACRYEEGRTKSLSLKAVARQDLLLDKALPRLLPSPIHGRRAGEESRFDAIAVGTGPGRFTGIRIGVAFAVVLGRTLGVPVAGFRGLESLAYQASWEKGTRFPATVGVSLPSVRDEVFCALYRLESAGRVRLLGEERWEPRPEFERRCRESGAAAYARPLKAETLARRVAALLEARRPLPPPEPYYLKPGNFERPR